MQLYLYMCIIKLCTQKEYQSNDFSLNINMRKSLKKNVPRSPIPSDYGLPVGVPIIIDEIRQTIVGESNRIRYIIVGVTIVFSVIPIFILGIINSSALGGSKFDAILTLVGIYLFPIIGLLGSTLAEDVFDNKNSKLKKRYGDYSSDLQKYQDDNNQSDYYNTSEYEMTSKVSEYLDFRERKLLNWGLHFCTLEENTLKLSSTQAIALVDKYDELTHVSLSEEELRFELTNLPYSLAEVSEVLIKAGNVAAEHKIEGSDDMHVLGITFHMASENLKVRRGERFQASAS